METTALMILLHAGLPDTKGGQREPNTIVAGSPAAKTGELRNSVFVMEELTPALSARLR